MKKFLSTMFLSFCLLLVSACDTLTGVVDSNTFLVSSATRFAVVDYIDKPGASYEEKQKRASDAKEFLEKARTKVKDNSLFAVSELISFIGEGIDWQSLTAAEQIAVKDILYLVSLQFTDTETGLSEETRANLDFILSQAISATEIF